MRVKIEFPDFLGEIFLTENKVYFTEENIRTK
jgi:hypothetical protein